VVGDDEFTGEELWNVCDEDAYSTKIKWDDPDFNFNVNSGEQPCELLLVDDILDFCLFWYDVLFAGLEGLDVQEPGLEVVDF
jgi:hypothetical protein